MFIYLLFSYTVMHFFSLAGNNTPTNPFNQAEEPSFNFAYVKQEVKNPDNWHNYRGQKDFLLYDKAGRIVLSKEEYDKAQEESQKQEKRHNGLIFYNGRHHFSHLSDKQTYWLLSAHATITHDPSSTNSNCFRVRYKEVAEADVSQTDLATTSETPPAVRKKTYFVEGTPTEEDTLIQNTTVSEELSKTPPFCQQQQEVYELLDIRPRKQS